MKYKLLLFTALLFSAISNAQITFEHHYPTQKLSRGWLDTQTLVYYLYNHITSNVDLYDSNHNFLLSIAIPNADSNNTIYLHDVSRYRFNNDDKIEAFITYYSDNHSVQNNAIINQDGVILLNDTTANSSWLSKIKGQPDKILMTGNGSKVYDAKTLQLDGAISETVYPWINFQRVKLSGNKVIYYFVKKNDFKLELFNSDFSHWKTIDLYHPENGSIIQVLNVSDSIINPDQAIEFTVGYSIEGSYGSTALMNDEGDTLKYFLNSDMVLVNSAEGEPTKLFNALCFDPVEVYSTPSYQLDTVFSDYPYMMDMLKRKEFGNWGAKYYMYRRAPSRIELYNNDYSIFKSFTPILNSQYVEKLSLNLINDDTLFEYACHNDLTNHTFFVNELDVILFEVDFDCNIVFDSTDISNIKLFLNNSEGTRVYCLKNNCAIANTKETAVLNFDVYPNPGSGIFTVDVPAFMGSYHLSLYDITGKKLVSKKYGDSKQTIDLIGYAKGMYFLTIETGGKQLAKKIILE